MDSGILPGIRVLPIIQEPLKGLLIAEDLPEADVSITGCEALIARTGSILMSSDRIAADWSVCMLRPYLYRLTNQLVYDIREGLDMLMEKYKNKIPSFITMASG
jgi:L-lactate dehydrogenase complex protein LldG